MAVKAMPFTIDQNQSGITAANGTAAIMSDIYVYVVPRHTQILIRPQDVISAYLKDAGAEAVATDKYELVVRDPNGLTSEIMASGMYTQIKDFTDQNKVHKLGQAKTIKSDFQIVLRVKATTVLVVSTCYFQITCLRYAETL